MTKTMTEMTLIKISLQKRNYFKKYMREGCMFNSMFKAIPICVFESTPECSPGFSFTVHPEVTLVQ